MVQDSVSGRNSDGQLQMTNLDGQLRRSTQTVNSGGRNLDGHLRRSAHAISSGGRIERCLYGQLGRIVQVLGGDYTVRMLGEQLFGRLLVRALQTHHQRNVDHLERVDQSLGDQFTVDDAW